MKIKFELIFKREDFYPAIAGMMVILIFPRLVSAEPNLRIVQPYEGSSIGYVTQSFVFGSVSPATAPLTINGIPVKPHSNGGFLAMIPFREGKFKIEAVASDGVSITTVTRTVNVSEANRPFPKDSSALQVLSPPSRIVLRPDDILSVSFKAAPGGTGSFRFREEGGHYPMTEVSPGIYRGSYKIQFDDHLDADDVIFTFKRSDGRKIVAKAKSKITIQKRRSPRFVELIEDAVLLTGPGGEFGYNLFPLKGVRFEVTGEFGDFLRLDLDAGNTGWIGKSSVKELPSGTAPAKSISRNIRIHSTSASTLIEIPLSYVHAHRVDEMVNPYRLELTLFGVIADTDRIRFLDPNSVVKQIYWKQVLPESYTLVVVTSQNYPWGYDVRYEGTKLVLEIRHAPPWNPGTKSPLRGLKVALDAGHSVGSYGTIGPLGNTEARVNLLLARTIAEKLKNLGAQVSMIQDGTKELSLQNRVDLAWKERSHVFISLHTDACGEGEDPREVEGYSVHYYNISARPLAERIRSIYGKRSNIRDQGLWRSNLAVCRNTTMPALLFEQGFLILPEYEEQFLKKEHQSMVGNVLGEALIDFLRDVLPR